MGNFLRFIGGLALGFAAGAGITALLTPRAGTEVQDVLRQHVDSALEEGRAASAAKRAELERQAGIRPD